MIEVNTDIVNEIIETVNYLLKKHPVRYSTNKQLVKNRFNLKELNLKRGMFCYLLFNGSECIYCGISKGVRNRLLSHKKNKDFDYIVLFEFNNSLYWRQSEKVIIKSLMPTYNILYNLSKKL